MVTLTNHVIAEADLHRAGPWHFGRFSQHPSAKQGCKSLLSIGGDNLQFYPNFSLFSTLGGMNLDHHFFQMSKLSEEQKKRSSPKMEHFFPRIQVKTKKKVFTKNGTRCVTKNSQWGGTNFGVFWTNSNWTNWTTFGLILD